MLDRRESMLCPQNRVLMRLDVIGLVLVAEVVVEDVTDKDDELNSARMWLGGSATRSVGNGRCRCRCGWDGSADPPGLRGHAVQFCDGHKS
jgi:hypothetical protein